MFSQRYTQPAIIGRLEKTCERSESCDTQIMASTSIGVDCTGPSIRAVLAEHAAERCAEFEAEFRIALAEADDDFDLKRVQAVVDKWWPIAYSTLHPPAEEERALVARFRAGDDRGLWRRDYEGNWTRCVPNHNASPNR